MPTTTARVPGQRTPADAGPSTSQATIRLYAEGERRPARCNAPAGRVRCDASPLYRTVLVRRVIRFGQRPQNIPQDHAACARHGEAFAARHGLDLPVAVS